MRLAPADTGLHKKFSLRVIEVFLVKTIPGLYRKYVWSEG